MREETLTRWVDQPPADPLTQHLRDAERERALALLGERGRVLDVASETGVTANLDAEAVTRVDFADAAGERAETLLGDRVERYERVSPESPRLPFPENGFDAAVCVGPYDWRFLDVEALTAEVRRVVAPGGRFVFSVPTPRSPYETGGRFRMRYYEPSAVRDLLDPNWALADYRLVYQHPYWLHSKLATFAPAALQRPFVAHARRATARLNAPGEDGHPRGDPADASYLVVSARPADREGDLARALDCLFRPAEEDGFWLDDGAGGHVARELTYEVDDEGRPTNWTVNDDTRWRYAPFALMGAMQWRVSAHATDEHDARLRRQLAYVEERIDDCALDELPSYGLGPLTCAFALAGDAFDDRYLDRARALFDHAEPRTAFDHGEDALVLYGWTYLYERTADPAVRAGIDRGMASVVDRQDARTGLFEFANPTTRRHQNQMYALWGLCRAIEATDRPGYLENAAAVLEYTVAERMREDGAFLWEDPSRRAVWGAELRRRLGDGERRPHWAFLYACHQTFFVNAVAHYYAAGGERDYDADLGRAMRWLDGENDRGTGLAAESGLGVPLRFVTTEGDIDVPDQRFKGAYEVGSRVMALTNLLDLERERVDGPASAAPPAPGAGAPASTDPAGGDD